MKQVIVKLPSDPAATRPLVQAANSYGISSFLAEGHPDVGSGTLYAESSFRRATIASQKDILDISQAAERREGRAKDEDLNILIRTEDWRVIPLENLISRVQGKGVHIFAEAKDKADAIMLSGVLEEGVEGVIIEPNDAEELLEYLDAMGLGRYEIDLIPAAVSSIEIVGLGERSCIDTANLLHQGEGMLLGSFSSFFFLVHAEVAATGFTSPRPFRVNAGGIHNYIMLPDGRTKYLSEIAAGDHVLVVSVEGEGRRAIVGRSKIERRPLALIRAASEQLSGSVILQYAETISLLDRDRKPIPVTSLKVGDTVLVHPVGGPKGRHFGVAIDETIIEK